MAQFRFLYNLNQQTFDARRLGLVDPSGYLLSIHRYSGPVVRFAQELNREYDETLMADNGFFARIRETVSAFEQKGAALHQQIDVIKEKLGRPVREQDVPPELAGRYRALAVEVRNAVYTTEKTHPVTFAKVLSEQAVISPDRQVCPEDIFLASLVGLNIEPEYLSLPRRFFRHHNKRSARFYTTAKSGDWGQITGRLISVASAVDYNTAFDAGREMARAKSPFLAIGTGAYMTDRNFTDFFRIQRKTTLLSKSVPRRYLRTVLTAAGLLKGYHEEAGCLPDSVHYLGLGTPIMLLMAAWISRNLKETSFDATSPIKDAVEGTLYVNEPSYLKIKTRQLVEYYAKNPDKTWACPCPYCASYIKKYPMTPSLAAKWWAEKKSTELCRDDLKEGTVLCDALPLLAEPSGGEILADISDWRSGHNHMMLEAVMADLNKANMVHDLREFVEEKVKKYCESALPHYAHAIETAWEISQDQNL